MSGHCPITDEDDHDTEQVDKVKRARVHRCLTCQMIFYYKVADHHHIKPLDQFGGK